MVTVIVHTEDTDTLKEMPHEFIGRNSKQSEYNLVDFENAIRAEELYSGSIQIEFENHDTEYTLRNTEIVGVYDD